MNTLLALSETLAHMDKHGDIRLTDAGLLVIVTLLLTLVGVILAVGSGRR